jgi:hypothetical protein
VATAKKSMTMQKELGQSFCRLVQEVNDKSLNSAIISTEELELGQSVWIGFGLSLWGFGQSGAPWRKIGIFIGPPGNSTLI